MNERKASQAGLLLAALGVVFGDIGTSPLYAFRECINPPHGVLPSTANVLGVLSLVFWSLTMVVTVKYLAFILRADNRGEGGVLALLALVPPRSGTARIGGLAVLGIAGAALLFGDGMITPAISVLSAIEGLAVAASPLRPLVVPVTLAILVGLFAIQKRGTGGIGRAFGPVMLVWFAVLAVLGAVQVVRNPSVLSAVWPGHAVRFFLEHGGHGFRLLGSVVLTVTGGEALYADLGHFGARPIRRAWIALVFPSLLLSYFGQGSLVLAHPEVAPSVFFALAPGGIGTWLLVLLSTVATVIASQALISGAFSLTHQAVQLGYFPRVTVRHTSHETEGQIYIPEINWGLAIGCLVLVLQFRESGRLAAAYGVAVSGTMAVTSVLFYIVTRKTWGWSRARALPLLLLFLAFDLPFLAANLLKFTDGGWIPVAIGGALCVVMLDWKWGRSILREWLASRARPWEELIAELRSGRIVRTPGLAVYLASDSTKLPPFFLHHALRVGAVTERVIVLTIEVCRFPVVRDDKRIEVEDFGQGVHRIVARYGFMEVPVIPKLLVQAAAAGLIPPFDADRATYYLGRETILARPGGRMGRLSEGLFAFLSRNAQNPTDYFGLPPEQVVEIGTQVDL